MTKNDMYTYLWYIFKNIKENNTPSCGNYLQLITKQFSGYIIHMYNRNRKRYEGKDKLSAKLK